MAGAGAAAAAYAYAAWASWQAGPGQYWNDRCRLRGSSLGYHLQPAILSQLTVSSHIA